MRESPIEVLILDGDENQAVASVRDLGKAGLRVYVAESFRFPKASMSRYAERSFVYRSPRTDKDGFLTDLLQLINQMGNRAIVLLPMTETTTLALSEARDALETAGYLLVLPEHSSLTRAFDKDETSKLATVSGVVVPRQVVVEELSELGLIAELPMPVVVKATASNALIDGKQIAAPRPRYATSLPAAEVLVLDLLNSGFTAVVQEFIEGVGIGFFALYEKGVLRRSFAHQRIRDVHPTGSGSSYRMSIEVSDELLAAGTSILDRLDWHGAAMVEFKRTPNGRLVFLEVNGRLWGSLSLAVSARAHFPRWMVSLATGKPLEPQPEVFERVRSRWILGEIRHLVAVFRGKPSGFPGRFPSRAETLRSIVAGLGTDRFDNFELADPLPELGDWLSAARKLARASRLALFPRF